ncbi:hypothetical protein HPP92_004358 [Vanilla planifolia]|uniref:Uncharacterized protein n=1 Tax=Vanilla planifolia TaxID=51239 RepID=A0A835RQ87_VANPL|nr:hypothetical protein HPP92_004358 [Vanilla planifolia]
MTGPALFDLLIGRPSSRSATIPSPGEGGRPAEYFRFRVEFQWFLTALSVRPLSNRAMVAHLFPKRWWALMMSSSSSGEKERCSTDGDSWLHHRSRHDFPDLPGIDLLISDQFLAPSLFTSLCNISSSSGLHGPLIRSISLLLAAAVDSITVRRDNIRLKNIFLSLTGESC